MIAQVAGKHMTQPALAGFTYFHLSALLKGDSRQTLRFAFNGDWRAVLNGRLPTREANQIVDILEQQLEHGEWTEDVLYGAYAARAIADPKMTLEPEANVKAQEAERARQRARAAFDRAADRHKDVRSIVINEDFPVLSWSSEQRSTTTSRVSDSQALAPAATGPTGSRKRGGATGEGRSSGRGST